jgi:hypothetical protein
LDYLTNPIANGREQAVASIGDRISKIIQTAEDWVETVSAEGSEMADPDNGVDDGNG